jgi:hypothetical protein
MLARDGTARPEPAALAARTHSGGASPRTQLALQATSSHYAHAAHAALHHRTHSCCGPSGLTVPYLSAAAPSAPASRVPSLHAMQADSPSSSAWQPTMLPPAFPGCSGGALRLGSGGDTVTTGAWSPSLSVCESPRALLSQLSARCASPSQSPPAPRGLPLSPRGTRPSSPAAASRALSCQHAYSAPWFAPPGAPGTPAHGSPQHPHMQLGIDAGGDSMMADAPPAGAVSPTSAATAAWVSKATQEQMTAMAVKHVCDAVASGKDAALAVADAQQQLARAAQLAGTLPGVAERAGQGDQWGAQNGQQQGVGEDAQQCMPVAEAARRSSVQLAALHAQQRAAAAQQAAAAAAVMRHASHQLSRVGGSIAPAAVGPGGERAAHLHWQSQGSAFPRAPSPQASAGHHSYSRPDSMRHACGPCPPDSPTDLLRPGTAPAPRLHSGSGGGGGGGGWWFSSPDFRGPLAVEPAADSAAGVQYDAPRSLERGACRTGPAVAQTVLTPPKRPASRMEGVERASPAALGGGGYGGVSGYGAMFAPRAHASEYAPRCDSRGAFEGAPGDAFHMDSAATVPQTEWPMQAGIACGAKRQMRH